MITFIKFLSFYSVVSYLILDLLVIHSRSSKINQIFDNYNNYKLDNKNLYFYILLNFHENLFPLYIKERYWILPLCWTFISFTYLSNMESYKLIDIIMIVTLIISVTSLIRSITLQYLHSFQYSTTSLIMLILYFSLISIQYFLGFLKEEITNHDFNFTIFLISIYFLVASLIFIIKACSLSKNKSPLILSLLFIYMVIVAFLSYLYIGYGLTYYDVESGLNNVNIDMNYPIDSFVIFVYHGLWSMTNLPEVIFSQEVLAVEDFITIESIYLRLVSIAFTTIYSALILGYVSNSLFNKK